MSRLSQTASAAAILCCTSAAFVPAALPPERSVSSSRQFIVYGNDARLRGAICDVAERCKREVLRLLGERDEWKTPVVIQVRYPDASAPGAPVAQLKLNQTGSGLKFQLELCLAREIGVPEVEREMVRMILLEMAYRQQPDLPAGAAYAEPPDWLAEGILALAAEGHSAFLAQTLATASTGDMLTLEKFLGQKRVLLDSPSQTLYRAYSAALISLLIDGSEGRARLARFVSGLAEASNNPFADLTAYFPNENAEQVEKAWRFHVARLANSESYRLSGPEETERELAKILPVNVRTADRTATYGLEEFPEFLRDPSATADLKRLATELLLLSGRANPLYRPIIGEYQQIVARLLRKKTKGVPHRLAAVRSTREHLSRQMNAIADYMNWFEATQARTSSGTFREYFRAAELALEGQPRRRDPISVYLDALETQF